MTMGDTDGSLDPLPLPRKTFVRADGRRIHLYGDVRGKPSAEAVHPEPTSLHLRRDELSASWVAISPERNVRPHASAPSMRRMRPGSLAARFDCPLCPGGPELEFGYDAAVFDNRFPALTLEPPVVPEPDDRRFGSSLGSCEVVMFTDRHEGDFAGLTPEETARVVAIWRDRTAALWADDRIALVLPFENRGIEVGATLSHPHGQIYAFGHLPPWIERRVAALVDGRERTGACVSCTVLADQLQSDRVIARDPDWLIGVPFAARWPFEVHVRALRHGARRLADLTTAEARSLAGALHGVVERYNGLFGFELPYMLVIHEAPRGADDWHLAVELYPPHRSAVLTKVRASVETATLTFINDTIPEMSAARLRAVPVMARDEHPGFVVVPSSEAT